MKPIGNTGKINVKQSLPEKSKATRPSLTNIFVEFRLRVQGIWWFESISPVKIVPVEEQLRDALLKCGGVRIESMSVTTTTCVDDKCQR